jgi:hypothetical protein
MAKNCYVKVVEVPSISDDGSIADSTTFEIEDDESIRGIAWTRKQMHYGNKGTAREVITHVGVVVESSAQFP